MFYTSNEAVFKLIVQGLSHDSHAKSPETSIFPNRTTDQIDSFFGSQDDASTTSYNNLQVLSFEGFEGLSTPYAFEVQLVNQYARFDITQLLSKPVYLAFTPDGKQGIHGFVSAVKRGPVDNHYGYFSIIITPRFKELAKRTNQRIFLDKTVPEIIKHVLAEYGILETTGFEFKFKETYPQREYCTQYDETDEHFIHRLCQEEGLTYHFEFNQENHLMVFTDAQPFFPNLKEAIRYLSDSGMVADEPVIRSFNVNLSSRTQSVTWRDYDFTTTKIPEGKANGTQSQKANDATEQNLEFYDYPGRYTEKHRADQLAQIQIERLRSDHIVAEGLSDSPVLHSGYFLSVEDNLALKSLDAKEPWLLNYIRHQGRQPQVLEALGDSASADNTTSPNQLHKYLEPALSTEFADLQFATDDFNQGYRNSFKATPKEVVWRPPQLHPKPKVLGSQTAVVTGPASEEIYCDEYGRVKVQFHWDREGQKNEHTSCWIRVASNWASKGYGGITIPRIGMEVVITYLESDPDQPLITGCVYNGVNTVPYELPANKTKSVFKTSSSKGGVGSNELRIEDKAGEEEVFVQSQKNFNQLTKNNHNVHVKNDSHLQVDNEHSQTTKANHYLKDEKEFHHITDTDAKREVGMNNYKTVGIAEHNIIGTTLTTEAGTDITFKSGISTVIDGGVSLTLKAGGQHIILNPSGIWMTLPQWPGGAPMEGTPAIPMPPLEKGKTVAATSSPVVLPHVTEMRQQITYLGQVDLVASPICQKIENPMLAEGDTNACALGNNCPCKQKRESQGVA